MKISLPRDAPSAGITVVVPCYRYGHFLHRVVGSILEQPDVSARVIIVDDASPDESAEVARAIAREDSRVSVIVHRKNLGHIATYNDGLALVETEFVSLVSADDLVAPGALGRATRLMSTHPRVGLVYGGVVDFVDDDVPIGEHRWGRETWSVWSGRNWWRGVMRRGKNPILSPEVVMRTSTLRDVGAYSSALPHSGDLEYWLRAAAVGDIGRVNGRAQAYYRVHGNNMHLWHFEATAEDLGQRALAFAAVAGGVLPDGFDGFEGGHLATRALAREAIRDACRRLDRGATTDEVRPLVEFAREHTSEIEAEWIAQAVTARIRRSDAGLKPARLQQAVEFGYSQKDRIRFKVRNVLGIGNVSNSNEPGSTIETADA